MFEIGWTEMLVIAIVMIVVVGPKDLPKMLRTFGRTTQKLRSMAGDFRKQFDEALKEAELDDVKGLVDDVRKLNPANEIRQAMSPMQKAAADVRAGLDSALNPAKSATAATAAAATPALTPMADPTPARAEDAAKPMDDPKPAAEVAVPLAQPLPSTPPVFEAVAKEPRRAAPRKAAAAKANGAAKPPAPRAKPSAKAVAEGTRRQPSKGAKS